MPETHGFLNDCTISDRYLEVDLSLRGGRLFLLPRASFLLPSLLLSLFGAGRGNDERAALKPQGWEVVGEPGAGSQCPLGRSPLYFWLQVGVFSRIGRHKMIQLRPKAAGRIITMQGSKKVTGSN